MSEFFSNLHKFDLQKLVRRENNNLDESHDEQLDGWDATQQGAHADKNASSRDICSN